MLSTLPSPARRLANGFCATASAALLVLTGCAGFSTVVPGNVTATSAALTGAVHGGQQPVTGSHVHLYSVGTGGYGSASNNIITTATGSDADGNYVLTDANGNFSLPTGSYSCTNATDQTYLLASGGNPGLPTPGTDNSAIVLLAALGACGNIASLPNAVINELSTVAAVSALQQFIVDPSHIGATTNGLPNLAIAAGLANDLVPIAAGAAATSNAAGTGITPQAEVNTLGNVLAPCVNSASPTSTACANLFSAVTPSTGTAPTDVTGAMLLIAQNSFRNAGSIFNLAVPASVFQPQLSSAPYDFSLAITYSGGGLASAQNIAIDATGDAFVTNCPSCSGAGGTDSIVGFSPSGAILTGATGYVTNIHKPTGIAFDNAGNLWSTNLASGATLAQIVKQSGSTVAFAFNDANVNTPNGIAIDKNNNAWITNQNASSIEQILANGTRTLAPVTRSGFFGPNGIAINPAQNIYAIATGSSNILEVTNAGAYVNTFTGSNLNNPVGLTLDGLGNLFTINNDSSATVISSSTGAGASNNVGVDNANFIAIDGFGTGWIANSGKTLKGDLLHVTKAPAAIYVDSYPAIFNDPNLNGSSASAIDGAGNVWVTNAAAGSVTEFIGIAGPTVTPIAAASATGTVGTRP